MLALRRSGMGSAAPNAAEQGAAVMENAAEAEEFATEEAVADAAPAEAAGTVEGATLLAGAVYPEAVGYEDFEAQHLIWTENQTSEETKTALNSFAYATAARILRGDTQSGCVSPLSLYQTLAILASGSDGQTRDQLLSLLGQGDLDTLADQAGRLYRVNYKDNEDYGVYLNGNVDYCYINPNSDNPVWANKNFRLALNYALNRVEYNQLANAGLYEPYNALCFPGLSGKDGKTYGESYDVDSYAYPMEGDVDKAKEYLKAAMDELGIADPSEIEIEFVTTDAESNKKIAEVLQEQWQNALGIKVNIRQVTYADIYGEVYPKFDYEIGYAGWGPDFDDPTTYLNLFRSDINWYTPYGNPDFDAKLDAAMAETEDANKRMDLLNEAEQILIADGAWVPLQARNQSYLLNPKMKDVTFYSFSINIDWAYADIAE